MSTFFSFHIFQLHATLVAQKIDYTLQGIESFDICFTESLPKTLNYDSCSTIVLNSTKGMFVFEFLA